jgi:hypothetical protein
MKQRFLDMVLYLPWEEIRGILVEKVEKVRKAFPKPVS